MKYMSTKKAIDQVAFWRMVRLENQFIEYKLTASEFRNAMRKEGASEALIDQRIRELED